ncbi:hypothetical protein [Amycolatopsis sp. NPDC006125]|uniref:hypothetical protein n=1 Tax=Amycolatopsis sp. NPDC006125 TaxID=3156730 RepID=UPI00339DC0FF
MFENVPVLPTAGHLQVLRTPLRVWVNLSKVYPDSATNENHPQGVDLRATVPGLLKMWDRTTTGKRLAWVAFTIGSAATRSRVGQWVLADAIRPREGDTTKYDCEDFPAMPVLWRRGGTD